MPLRPPRWYLHPIALTVAALAAAVALHLAGALSRVEAVAVQALRPLQRAFVFTGTAVGQWWENRTSLAELTREHRQAVAAFQRLAVENQQLKERLKSYALLQEQTDWLRERRLPAVSVRVVGKDLGPAAQAVILDRGRRAGILAGAPVVVQNGILIGQVTEVGEEHAKAMLLTDGRSATAVALDGRDGVMGVASGGFGVSLKLDLVPVDQALAVGELVVTSGLQAGVPRGLLVGTVSRITDTPSQFFHLAYVQPLVPYQSLSVAAVLVGR